ncbi:MAG TPA: chaperone NapD [Luteibacter sp.]|jgi:nitrate reductase NapD|uniref:chaperone NapD n=1 Tax=Luteibacter sp. TaxID=1886636 RepID=UPI002F428E46
MSRELHISSLFIQHRPDALPQLRAFIDARPELELALNEGIRSIVLCETGDQRGLMDHIDAMRDVVGVLNVSLIYHHAEPREALDQLMPVVESMEASA